MSRLVRYFYLSPLHCDSNRVLEVLNFHTHNRAPLGLRNLSPGAANQLWAFVPCGGGFYEIINKNSTLVLDDSVPNAPGGTVYQHSRHGGPNQHWRIRQTNDKNHVQIFAKVSNFVLDVGDRRRDNGAPIVLWHDWKGPNQIWRLIRA